MVILKNVSMEVLRMNKASVLVKIDGSEYLATRNVFNMIAANKVSEIIVVQREHNGITSHWLAIASIF